MSASPALSAEHHHELQWDSCITPSIIQERGYRTLLGHQDERQLLEDLGFKPYVWNRDDAYPGLLIPMHGADGTVRGHQFKPAAPRIRMKADGAPAPIKYESPAKAPLVVDVPAFTRARLADTSTETASLWITEGMKKTDSLISHGMAAVGLTGVFNWRNAMGTLGDWEELPLKGRPVVICFDSDAAGNRNVQLAMSRLGAWLRTRGVAAVHYLVVPAEVDGVPVKGVDDFFAAGGTLEVLSAAATQTAPGAGEKDASFTDAFLVEELSEALDGRFCWASGLGWLRWNGRIWKDVSDVEPLEAVRVWASEQFDKILTQQRQEPSRNLQAQIAGWRAILGKARLTALRDLARGLIQRDAAEFDGDPDLLTCLNGTLHLPSGRLLPFDPAHHITKSADAEYHRDFRHPLWDKALQAVPVDLHPWYQDRLGQALTGHPVPDHTLVIAHGTGSNGKSTIVSTVRRTLGDYGVMISDRVLMASPDAHPTELMDLRGARYAVLEETPEARHLNVQRLKSVLGTESIKARRIRQDPVEFLTSHSLFINTNYRPVVTETDWGTWRRLSLMPYPYTFKKPGMPLETAWDRVGDPALAYAQNDPQVRAAALSWMAEGARAWYTRGRMMLPAPERVEKETRAWRSETDLILGFSDECLKFGPELFTQTRDMLAAFNEWAGERGHRPWNDRTFATRFGDHDSVRGAKVKQGRFTVRGKQQRGWGGVEINTEGRDPFTGELDEPPLPPEPEELDVRNTRPAPVALGFDLETASAEELFLGRHEGPFVRLAGWKNEASEELTASPGQLLATLNSVDTIYGANIVGFDLLALAHHHGADFDALAAKAVDLMVRERLIDPPLSKGMPNGYYGLDAMAERYGVAGKTDDLKALAKRHGGYDKIPVTDPEYVAYLRGDLAATKAVYDLQSARIEALGLQDYDARERRVVALQNRMTLNGWAIDTELLAERAAHEESQKTAAVLQMSEKFGVPLQASDRFKLRLKSEWPADCQSIAVTDARVMLRDRPEECVTLGMAERIPGEPHLSPWATTQGRSAIEQAFHAAGATHLPRTKSGGVAMSSEALGEGYWYDKNQGKSVPGLLEVYGDKPGVRDVAETLLLATGARSKYAEIAKYVTPQGRVHAGVGAAQGSGRWAMTKPSVTNMGKRGAAGEERAVLVADEGHVLLACDLSQVDVRAVAGLCQDPALIERLQPGRDYHTEMAGIYFGDPGRRDESKPISHGLNYGQGARAIAERNRIDQALVQHAMAERREAFPLQMKWTESVVALAETGQLLDNGFGRLMRPEPARAYTQGPALMGQGAARDIMCQSLLRLVERAPEVTPLLRGVVHDEVVLSVPEEDVPYWSRLLEAAFTWEWRGVPILCEVSKPAFRWSECK